MPVVIFCDENEKWMMQFVVYADVELWGLFLGSNFLDRVSEWELYGALLMRWITCFMRILALWSVEGGILVLWSVEGGISPDMGAI